MINLSSDDILINNLHESNINIDSREIFLHSYVSHTDEEPGIDYRVASNFIKNALLLDRLMEDHIIIHMSTLGGDWNYGIAIYDTICNLRSYVTIIAYGYAASMTSIILQAADRRLLMPNTDFLIHYGSIEISGSQRAVESTIDWSKNLNNKMLWIYADKCKNGDYFKGWGTTKIFNYLTKELDKRQDWYMTPEEAVNRGFADGIIGKDILLCEVLQGL